MKAASHTTASAPKDIETAAADLVEAARRAGADAADTVVVRGIALGVSVRDGKVEESERSEGDEFGLRVFVGRRVATVSANRLDDPRPLAERAVAMAKAAPEDPYAGLAPADRLANAATVAARIAALDLVDPTEPSVEALTEIALAAEAAALAVPGVTRSSGASAGWSRGGLVLVTSGGFSASYIGTRHSRSMTAIAGEGTGMERDWWSSAAIHASDLEPAEDVGRRAGERAVKRVGPRKVATGITNVVYDPRVSTSLIGHLAGAVNGAAIARGTSFLKERLGERIFAAGLRITDDPMRPRGLGSRPFDGEGLASEPFALIEDGVLTQWLLDSATARELGLQSNGRASRGIGGPSPGTTNLTLEAGTISPAALLKEIGTGLYVTDLIGSGANLITGDYSRGAAGFWIENGEIAYPVSEVTIAGRLPEMFARARPADDLVLRFAANAPTIAIEGLTVAGR
ncbi:TldD/PmbA family protein [Segnochrobactrum spirostomi]|uniref:TldD/PmbA family protein n=1 Tax=Segnochrobactrum spirostomi TaxID=2608987 RepID=A0A6A7Y550_9HYPH|nr:TldD/PmbA family protein [Segnochrobactrum spirostomi]MQT13886.1 TldD/PmbA family protein [Segnochrobactrum spirostomi]